MAKQVGRESREVIEAVAAGWALAQDVIFLDLHAYV